MSPDPNNVTEVAAQLYALPPEQFVAARNAAAKQATGPAARHIKALRRPTVSAWLVNLLAFHRADDLAALLDLGERLRAAQRELAGPAMRELSRDRQELITALIREARQLAAEHGKTIRDDAAWEAESTLRAATADPDTAERVRAGTLVRPVDYHGTGLGELGTAGDTAATSGIPRETKGDTSPATARPPGSRSARRETRPADDAAAEAEAPTMSALGAGRVRLRVIPGGRDARSTAEAAAATPRQRQDALREAERRLAEAREAEHELIRRQEKIADALAELRAQERALRAEQAEVDRARRRAERKRQAAEKAVADARRRLHPR